MLRRLVLFLALLTVSCSPRVSADPTEIANTPETTLGGEPNGGAISTDRVLLQDLVLTEDSLNPIPPEDIIQEVGFFGGLGGGGSLCDVTDYQEPIFLSVTDRSYEWMESVSVEVCVLDTDEDVKVVVTSPSGMTLSDKMVSPGLTDSGNKGVIYYSYTPDVYAPTGEYTITLTGGTWVLEYPFTVIEPPEARLFLDESQLFLINFSPNEEVRLFVYRISELGGKRFVGWKQFQVDDQGDLTLQLVSRDSYVVIGKISGQLTANLDPGDVYCDGARNPIGIEPYGYAEIRVNRLPSYRLDPIQGTWVMDGFIDIPLGTVVQIFSNAVCVDQTFLWSIDCLDDSCDYPMVPESGADGYYLRPLAELPPTSTPDPADIPACPGTKPTRLQVGMDAEVTTSGMAPQLSLRAQPGLNAEKVHVIAAGRDLVILDGPACADNSYWWFIRSEQGFEGWAREGDHEDYWIDPLP